jgi:hypothetical protein
MKGWPGKQRCGTVVAAPGLGQKRHEYQRRCRKAGRLLGWSPIDFGKASEDEQLQLIKRQIEKPVADAITAWITEYNASTRKRFSWRGISWSGREAFFSHQSLPIRSSAL